MSEAEYGADDGLTGDGDVVELGARSGPTMRNAGEGDALMGKSGILELGLLVTSSWAGCRVVAWSQPTNGRRRPSTHAPVT